MARRTLLVQAVLAAALSLTALLMSVTHQQVVPRSELVSRCPHTLAGVAHPPGDPACYHEDEPPPGVDPSTPVPTAELQDRVGAGPAAYDAAQDLGVPATQVAVNTADPTVPCDGDGSSGYRVQPMYVVEAGHTNRFSALQPSLQLWAAGADDVVNRSAALSGGVRHVRFVTEPGGGGCVAKVLNVTVPAGASSSFSATISAVQALGYSDPARKYLMWVDATALCGVATLYTNDVDSQANPNNGSYAQYARVDSGCWGLGDGSGQHSVEAHELLHTLGGVQNSAPHSTHAGHCWDESDTMCYADGGDHAMVQVCPPEREYLFDCGSDDYFSTFPDPGSYLDTHWNAADSRFLIGGGDGTGGGAPGSPTVLGATISVNNPAVPGLPTQVSVAPALPTGRTLASVQWKSARSDCAFSTPTQVQSDVTCSATSATGTTVTATLTDSSGATKAVSSPLTFSSTGPRAVTVALSVDGQDGASASVCTSAAFPVGATVTDVASGQRVKGLTVSLTKAGLAVGSALTGLSGAASFSQTTSVATSYTARTTGTTLYPSVASGAISVTAAQCHPALTASDSDGDVYYGDPVVVSGTLTRDRAGSTVPVSGATIAVRQTTTAGAVTTLATAKTAADGTWRATVKPTATGTLSGVLATSTAYLGTSATAGPITVRIPLTDLHAAVDRTDVGYGDTVTVTGSLARVAGTATSPLAAATVSVLVTPVGKTPVTVASGRTTSTGSFTVPVSLKLSGGLSVKYAGVTGQPAATVALGSVVAGTWATALTAGASTSAAPYGSLVTVSGLLTRSYGGVTEGAKGLTVRVMYRAPGATTTTQVASAVTTSTGSYSVAVPVHATGTWTVVLNAQAGYTSASAPALPITMTAPAG